MANYMDAVKARLARLNNQDKPVKKEAERAKFPFFKPVLGPDNKAREYDIRFLPYSDRNGQPFEEVLYYGGPLAQNRIIAPKQYQMPDPIATFLEEMQKETKGRTEEHKKIWKLWNSMNAKPKFYAVVIVRGEEDKGPQVWEFSPEVCKKIYDKLTDKEYIDEDLLDVKTGYDFGLKVSYAGKMWNGYPVKEFDLSPRRKSSKLGTPEQIEKWMAAMPKLEEYFKGFAPNEEKAQAIVDNYIASATAKTEEASNDQSASRGGSDDEIDENLKKAFSGLDEDLG